jgi:hypothetical protein
MVARTNILISVSAVHFPIHRNIPIVSDS